MIEFKNVEVGYGNKVLFTNFNLQIPEGKIIGVIAPSGTGKSTLFNAALGLLPIQNGEVTFNGQNLKTINDYERIAVMPQGGGLYDYLTGVQNFKFFANLKKVEYSKSEIEKLFTEYDLANSINKKVSDYSGGMRTKLSLMIALIGDSDYYFLDEPTVGIDPVQKQEFWLKINQLKNANKTVIVTTHVMDEASRCDQLCLLHDGQLIAFDTEANILKKYEVNNLDQAFVKMVTKEQDGK